MRIDSLCKSLCGNDIFCLTITNDLEDTYMSTEQEIEQYRIFEYEKGGCLKTVLKERKFLQKKKQSNKIKETITKIQALSNNISGSSTSTANNINKDFASTSQNKK